MDLKGFIDRLGDEFLTHHSLAPQKVKTDEDVPHPLKVNTRHSGSGSDFVSGSGSLFALDG